MGQIAARMHCWDLERCREMWTVNWTSDCDALAQLHWACLQLLGAEEIARLQPRVLLKREGTIAENKTLGILQIQTATQKKQRLIAITCQMHFAR